jgi:hypothetical protein
MLSMYSRTKIKMGELRLVSDLRFIITLTVAGTVLVFNQIPIFICVFIKNKNNTKPYQFDYQYSKLKGDVRGLFD